MKTIILFVMVLALNAFANKLDKLQERNDIIKASYKSVSDNAEHTDTWLGYVRYGKDVIIKDTKLFIIPTFDGKYEKRNNVQVNDKYDISLLLECDIPNSITGYYLKGSYIVDEANKIYSKTKTGIGMYQYLYRSDRVLLKTREGVQYSDTSYTIDKDSVNVAYIKFGLLSGYYYANNIFIKAKADYDLSVKNKDDIIDTLVSAEYSINDKVSIETSYSYLYTKTPITNLQHTQRVFTTYLIYKF